MKKFLMLLCAVMLIFSTMGTVDALTLSSVDGDWTNINGGSFIHYYNDKDVVRWGRAASCRGQSGLGFIGATTPLGFDIDEAFQIGELQHYNNPTYGTSATAAFLTVSMNFSGVVTLFDFVFDINETTNNTGTVAGDSDIITFQSSYASEVLNIGGVDYTLQLLGFGDTIDELVDYFASIEGSVNSTKLWGKITSNFEPVPEPATIFLLGVGLVGLAGCKRKTFKKV